MQIFTLDLITLVCIFFLLTFQRVMLRVLDMTKQKNP